MKVALAFAVFFFAAPMVLLLHRLKTKLSDVATRSRINNGWYRSTASAVWLGTWKSHKGCVSPAAVCSDQMNVTPPHTVAPSDFSPVWATLSYVNVWYLRAEMYGHVSSLTNTSCAPKNIGEQCCSLNKRLWWRSILEVTVAFFNLKCLNVLIAEQTIFLCKRKGNNTFKRRFWKRCFFAGSACSNLYTKYHL